jgi:hypothetical protein
VRRFGKRDPHIRSGDAGRGHAFILSRGVRLRASPPTVVGKQELGGVWIALEPLCNIIWI